MGLSNWFKKVTSPKRTPLSPLHPDCQQLLDMMLDGDPTPEQKEHFRHHIENCLPCAKSFELDSAIRQLLRTRCNGHPVPDELVQSIRNKVGMQAPT